MNLIKKYFVKEDVKFELEDFSYEEHIFQFQDLSFSYIDSCLNKSLPALLFIHGNPTSKEIWFPLIQELKSHFRCIAIDLFPKEDFHADEIADLSYSSELIHSFLDALTIKQTDVIVHDWGGCILLNLLHKKSEIFKKIIFFECLLYPVTFKNNFLVPYLLFLLGRTPFIGKLLLVRFNFFVKYLFPIGSKSKVGKSFQDFYLNLYSSSFKREMVFQWVHNIPFRDSENLSSQRKNFFKSTHKKLFFYAKPGLALKSRSINHIKSECDNLTAVDLKGGIHYFTFHHSEKMSVEIKKFLSK